MRSRLLAFGSLLLLGGWSATLGLAADDRIIIEGKLNDQPLKLAFDTGAGELVLLRPMAERRGIRVLPPPPDAQVKPGEVLRTFTEPVKLELLGQTFPAVALSVIDFPPDLVSDVDGAIGWSSIRSNIWLLSGSTLKFTGLDEVPAEAARWVKLKERQDQQTLCLELPPQKSGAPAYLGIDSGSSSGVGLSPEAWAEWRRLNPRQPITLVAYFMPAAGLVVAEVSWADKIDVGGLVLHGVPVSTMNRAEQAMYPAGTRAVLGLNALMRMDTVFDGKNGCTYANPLATPPAPYKHNRLGAVFVSPDLQQSDELLAHVVKGSPAAKAGVRDGDVLLKIDQLDVTPWRTQPGILPLTRFWEQPAGTKLHLTLRRDGKTVAVDAVLRTILGPEPK